MKNQIEFFEEKLKELEFYKENLNSENIDKFNTLISEISQALTGNQKIKFDQLEFFDVTEVIDIDFDPDDLPF